MKLMQSVERKDAFYNNNNDGNIETDALVEDEDKFNLNLGHDDTEMEQLEKEYEKLQNQEINFFKHLKDQKEDDFLKGQAVKNQKAIWDKTLELRFLIQKSFSNSNRLPRDPVKLSFFSLDASIARGYFELIASAKHTLDSLLELQEALLTNNSSITAQSDGMHEDNDDDWLPVSRMHKRIASFRDKAIDKWQRKAQVTTGAAAFKAKFQALNQDISEQVANYMRDPSRMIKQMQLRRSVVKVFGDVSMDCDVNGEESRCGGDPELVDDSEFYQQLLKEFLETVDPNSAEAVVSTLRRSRPKKRKVVDRRASKSRKIRYNVHEKMVNFMAPRPFNLPPMAPKLFENLFGLGTV